MNSCSNMFILSAIAYNLAECLTNDELELLSADLNVLGEMLAAIATQNTLCSGQ